MSPETSSQSKLDPTRHQRVKEIFGEVIDLPVDEVGAALERLCGDDAALRSEVESLLEHASSPRIAVDPASVAIRAAIEAAADDSDVHGVDEVGGLASAFSGELGEFTILRVLGEGGMGVVYLAEQSMPRRTVALKVIRPGLGGRVVLRRFRREAELLARLQHPNIAKIHTVGTSEMTTPRGRASVPYFAMEYVRGVAITEHCRGRGLTVRERVALMMPVCDAVEHAHRAGVLHRDLKPANILVDERGEPRILDFGIARASGGDQASMSVRTGTSEVVGTLPYMSPEQCAGRIDAVDCRTDVYALGVMLFELLAGRLPLDLSQHSFVEAVRAISEQEPPRLGSVDRALRGDLETIVGKCLEKDPGRRYQSAELLRRDLQRHLDDLPIEARPPSAFYQLRKFTRRNRGLVAGVAVAFVAMAIATAWSVRVAIVAEAARREAEAASAHAELFLGRAKIEIERSTESFRLLNDVILGANPYHGGRRDVTVVEMLDRSGERLRMLESDQPHVASMVLRLVGNTYFRLGDSDKALPILKRSVELHKQSDWGDRTYLILALLDLGATHRTLGQYDEAIASIEEAIGEIVDILAAGHQSVDLAHALSDLGLVRLARGDIEDAADDLAHALRLRIERGEEKSIGVAITMVNLGLAQMLLDRLDDATALLRPSLAMLLEIGGPTHQASLQAMSHLGIALARDGETAEAIELLSAVLQTRRELLPERHHERLASMANLAHAHALGGRSDLAEPLARDALAGRVEALGEDHADTIRSRQILALALLDLDRLDEARDLLQRSVEDTTRRFGAMHWMAGEAWAALARLENEAGNPVRAAECAEAAFRSIEGSQRRLARISAEVESALALWRAGDVDGCERRLTVTVESCLSERDRGRRESADALCAAAALRAVRARDGSAGSQADGRALREAAEALEAAHAALVRCAPGAPWRPALALALADELRQSAGDPTTERGSEARAALASAPARPPWWAREALGMVNSD